jgi:hypothetical protein
MTFASAAWGAYGTVSLGIAGSQPERDFLCCHIFPDNLAVASDHFVRLYEYLFPYYDFQRVSEASFLRRLVITSYRPAHHALPCSLHGFTPGLSVGPGAAGEARTPPLRPGVWSTRPGPGLPLTPPLGARPRRLCPQGSASGFTRVGIRVTLVCGRFNNNQFMSGMRS